MITKEYFRKGLLFLPNILIESGGIDPDISTKYNNIIDDAIERYEEQFLCKLLGLKVYEEFKQGLEATEKEKKWTDLKDKLINSESLRSPIANYIYCGYLQENETELIGTNSNIPKYENKTVVSNFEHIKNAWNDMVLQNLTLIDWLYKNKETYFTEFDRIDDWNEILEKQTYLG